MNAYCAGCGVVILPTAPIVTLSVAHVALIHGGTDWHPGCWDAHLRCDTDDVAREHLAAARAALARPSDSHTKGASA